MPFVHPDQNVCNSGERHRGAVNRVACGSRVEPSTIPSDVITHLPANVGGPSQPIELPDPGVDQWHVAGETMQNLRHGDRGPEVRPTLPEGEFGGLIGCGQGGHPHLDVVAVLQRRKRAGFLKSGVECSPQCCLRCVCRCEQWDDITPAKSQAQEVGHEDIGCRQGTIVYGGLVVGDERVRPRRIRERIQIIRRA